MARSYGKIKSDIWLPGNDYRKLSWGAQWLYQALTSQRNISSAGVLSLQPSKWARFASDLTEEAITTALQELIEERYVLVDWDTEEVLIRTFIRHDGLLRNQKMVKAIEGAVPRIESLTLRAVAANTLRSEIDRESIVDPPTDPVDISDFEKPQVERQSIRDRTTIDPKSILPAACSLQPLTLNPAAATHVSRTFSSSTNHPDDAAAAAREIFIAHRVRMVAPHNPEGFARSLRAEEPTRQRKADLDAYQAHHPAATAHEIAQHVYGLGPLDLHHLGVAT